MKALLIEDSPEIVNTCSLCFKIRWPEVQIVSAPKGARGVELAASESPDIIILDINLPDMEGFEVLKRIRQFSDVPIIILSVRDSELDKVRGLETGADDYITKPFSGLDFVARVKAALRRASPHLAKGEDIPPYISGDLSITFSTKEVTLQGQPVHFTPVEYKLLAILARSAGKVVSQESLIQQVWGGTDYVTPATLKKYIYQLRLKLDDTSDPPRLIHNERGMGYKLINTG